MRQISYVIFDLDGTLSQTNELIFATFNHIAQKYLGRAYASEEIIKLFGPPEEITIGRLVGKERIRHVMEDFYNFYDAHHPELASAYDGVREILEYLKSQDIILAIFTGKGKRSALITLDKIGIINFFDIIITGDDVENHKPSADGIRKVMSKFGLTPEQVLMVGDSVADVKAAHEAGVKIAAVLWDSYSKEKVLQMDVDYQFYSVKEFSDWLRASLSSS